MCDDSSSDGSTNGETNMNLNRRDAMIRLGQVGAGALTLPGLLTQQASARTTPGRAKSCILVYLWGGPPQQDMWDMKPEAPEGIRSLFRPIATSVPGMQISDQLPLTAQHADKMAIIRSLTHPSNEHEVGVYHTLSGKINNALRVPRNARSRRDFPNISGIVSRFTSAAGLPASVTIPRPIGHDGVVYAGTHAGFLGPRHDPMEVKPPGEVREAAPHSLEMPQEMSEPRLLARMGLLNQLDVYDRRMQTTGGLGAFREQAFRMLTSPHAKEAFRLEREPDRLRDRYGRNEYGECFLLARRLVEAGVRLVTITWYYICPDGNVANVWDNHGGTGSLGSLTGYEMLRQPYCLPSLDLGYSALLQDLSERGLLDDTMVAMFGEFGRTPRINRTGGRDHWGACQSAVLAGGGIRGGQIYGASDAQAAYPRAQPVAPEDLHATMYYALGISPDSEIQDRDGRLMTITTGSPLTTLF